MNYQKLSRLHRALIDRRGALRSASSAKTISDLRTFSDSVELFDFQIQQVLQDPGFLAELGDIIRLSGSTEAEPSDLDHKNGGGE